MVLALRGRGLAGLVYRRLLAVIIGRFLRLSALLLLVTAAPVFADSTASKPGGNTGGESRSELANEQRAEQAIRQAISGQIEAFARDDAKTAFSFAAPSIQRQFGSPDQFMMMVLRGYPMVYRPSTIEFLDASPNGDDAIMQSVRISDAGGKVWIAFYNMRMVSEGQWRIAGVRMREVDTTVI